MEDDDTQPTSERWEVLEFWGFVDTDLIRTTWNRYTCRTKRLR